MDEFLHRVWIDLTGRLTGPMQFRLLLQPLVACILAVRAGLRDAREGKAPFVWALAFDPEHRRELLRQAWKDIGRVFILAVMMDLIYQIIELHMFYPGEAIIVAMVLAIVPYLLVRAPVTRLAGWKKKVFPTKTSAQGKARRALHRQ